MSSHQKRSIAQLIWITLGQVTDNVKLSIMEEAVAPCPEIAMTIHGQTNKALLDTGSPVIFHKSDTTKNSTTGPWPEKCPSFLPPKGCGG